MGAERGAGDLGSTFSFAMISPYDLGQVGKGQCQRQAYCFPQENGKNAEK